jgi:hypothetical protein
MNYYSSTQLEWVDDPPLSPLSRLNTHFSSSWLSSPFTTTHLNQCPRFPNDMMIWKMMRNSSVHQSISPGVKVSKEQVSGFRSCQRPPQTRSHGHPVDNGGHIATSLHLRSVLPSADQATNSLANWHYKYFHHELNFISTSQLRDRREHRKYNSPSPLQSY